MILLPLEFSLARGLPPEHRGLFYFSALTIFFVGAVVFAQKILSEIGRTTQYNKLGRRRAD